MYWYREYIELLAALVFVNDASPLPAADWRKPQPPFAPFVLHHLSPTNHLTHFVLATDIKMYSSGPWPKILGFNYALNDVQDLKVPAWQLKAKPENLPEG